MKRLFNKARCLPIFAFIVIMGLFLVACGAGGGGSSPTPSPTGQDPAITSANSAVFSVGAAGTFTVTATGTPAPSITETASAPTSIPVTFVDNHNGTGTLTSTPTESGVETLTFTASNSTGSASQTFTLTVAQPGDNILPITNGITLATVNSHWVLVSQCEVPGATVTILGLEFELTSGDSGFKASFTDPTGVSHVSVGTWAASSGTGLLVTTPNPANPPGNYATSWTVSSLELVTGSTLSEQATATVNWFGRNNPNMQSSPDIPLTSPYYGCGFTLASGGI
ncbi:MAG TPA: hypothetical protein VKO18_22455 [Terriglobia bacterium]|nr:hypothetical protein [Terriglobia bacterium]